MVAASIVAFAGMSWSPIADAAPADSEPGASANAAVVSLLESHCIDCHSADYAEAGLRLDDLATGYDPAEADQFARLVKAHDRIAAGEMPPAEMDPPPADERAAVVATLARQLEAADRERQQADGRTRRRRLTRTEYEHAVHDLLQIQTPIAAQLPGDAVAHGFDKTADALGLSSVLMRQYLAAAREAVESAIVLDERPEQIDQTVSLVEYAASRDARGWDNPRMFRPLDDAVAVFSSTYCPSEIRSISTPAAGRYRITIEAYAHRNHTPAAEPVAYRVYAGPLHRAKGQSQSLGFFEAQPRDRGIDPIVIEAVLPARSTVKLVPWDTGYEVWKKDADRLSDEPAVAWKSVRIEGPIVDQWPPASQRRVFGDLPIITVGKGRDARREVVSATPRADAAKLLWPFAEAAFRRPVTADDVDPFVQLVVDKLDAGASFTDALPIGYQAILCDPLFLTVGCDAGREELSCYALASRLSLFLWGSTPDTELLDLASDNTLCRPEVLRSQARRMLADPRSERFVADFAAQWLDTAWLDAAMPDPELFPEYDELLRDSMERETLLTLRAMLDENRPAREIADADWAILNERMAVHYGLNDQLKLQGLDFRRVTLPAGSVRGGFLTQATIAKVTANGTHTTPVYRGFWVLDAILGQPTPPPPPNIPAVEPDVRGTTTIREKLAAHRADSACAVCHNKLDPAGFALESLDVIGTFRTAYRMPRDPKGERVESQIGNRTIRYFENPDHPVDASGEMADGETFADLREFKAVLARRDRQLARAFAEKLVVYGTGEGVSFCDRQAIEQIVTAAESSEYGLASLLEEVVAHPIFRRR